MSMKQIPSTLVVEILLNDHVCTRCITYVLERFQCNPGTEHWKQRICDEIPPT